MMKLHRYQAAIEWTGNLGTGTDNYRNYSRDYEVKVENKRIVEGSSDPSFRGDSSRYNPEELLLASIASCHLLWYLHLCADNGVIVESYTDRATGTMKELTNGSGHFTEVVLHPIVTVNNEAMLTAAMELHVKANAMCFIANSVKFPVRHQAEIKVK